MGIIFALVAALLDSFNPIIKERLLAETDVSLVTWAGQALGLPKNVQRVSVIKTGQAVKPALFSS
jgi:hypothetical protein